jgi:hypothetical protein
MYIENIIVGNLLVDEKTLFATNDNDWTNSEKEKTIYDNERFLPKLLVNHEFIKSSSEIKRNRLDLWKILDKPDFLEIKLGKKRLWIAVGE